MGGAYATARRHEVGARSGDCEACFEHQTGRGTLALDRQDRSLPGVAHEWQLPLPPVRFPLREALLQERGGDLPSPHTEAVAANAAKRGPLVVKNTEKSRAIRSVGQLKR